MWKLDEAKRSILENVVNVYCGKEAKNFDKSRFFASRIYHGEGDEMKGPTIANLLKADAISAAEVAAIYHLLPSDVEFYKFVDALEPIVPGSLSSGENEQEVKRRNEYRVRIQRLKEEQENKEYAEMTKTIDLRNQSSLMKDFGQEMRSANRQMIAVTNALITVGGAFVFGFYGIPMAYPHLQLEMATRMILGLIFATIVLFADFYFIIKNME